MMSTWIYPKLRPKQVSKDPINVLFTVLITYEKKNIVWSFTISALSERMLSVSPIFLSKTSDKQTNKQTYWEGGDVFIWVDNKQTNKQTNKL